MQTIDKGLYFNSIGYTPHSDAQWDFHNSLVRYKIPCCGRRFGKSTMAMRDREPHYLVPGNTIDWIVGPTYDLGEKEFRVLWDDMIIKKRLGHDKRVKRAYNKRTGDMFVQFPWGPRIEVRSASHPETLVGEALDYVIMSEAAKHSAETWERFIMPSLADKRGGASFPTTPEGHNWLYMLWQVGRDPAFEGHYKSWNFPSWLNKIVFPGGFEDPEIQLLLRTMSPEQFMQEIAADFSSFTGKIYSEFDENVHVQRHEYNPAWENYIAFDWGYTAPLAAIEFQVDPWGRVYIWREHYKSFMTLEMHLKELQARDQPDGYKIDCTFGDAADPEATLYVNQHFGPCISDPLAKSNWRQGVLEVKKCLAMRQVGSDEWDRPIEVPGLIVDHSCKNTIREFNTYKRKDTIITPNEAGAAGAAQRQDDHALDALRYGIMHRFVLGAQHHLSDVQEGNHMPLAAFDEFESETIFNFGSGRGF